MQQPYLLARHNFLSPLSLSSFCKKNFLAIIYTIILQKPWSTFFCFRKKPFLLFRKEWLQVFINLTDPFFIFSTITILLSSVSTGTFPSTLRTQVLRWLLLMLNEDVFEVYYESIKWEPKIRGINKCLFNLWRKRYHSLNWPRLPGRIFWGKNFFSHETSSRDRRAPKVGDGGVFHTTCVDFSRRVEELEYTCRQVLKNTFTEPSHDRGFKDTVVSGNLPWVSFVEKCIGGGRLTSNVTWTPTFRKQQLARKGLSQRVQNHNQHRVVRIEPV